MCSIYDDPLDILCALEEGEELDTSTRQYDEEEESTPQEMRYYED